jgi:hypothetical protein
MPTHLDRAAFLLLMESEMISRVDWGAVGLAVFVVSVVGFVVGPVLNLLTPLLIQQRSASEVAAVLAVFNLVSSCGLGLLYGAMLAAGYVWWAGRRGALEPSDAAVGAAISVLVFVLVTTLLGGCWSASAMMLSLQQSGVQTSLEEAAQVFGSVLFGAVLSGGIKLVAALIAALPTALLVARWRRPA